MHLVCVLVLVADLPNVDAKPREPNKQANRYEKKGKRAYAKKRWDDALVAFNLAYQADPLPRFLFNAGRSAEQKGDLVQAIDFVQRYVTEETDEEEKADGQASLEMLRAKLRTSHAPLEVTSKPSSARVVVQGQDEQYSGTTPYSIWLPVGVWQLRVSADGQQDLHKEVVAEPGQPIQFFAELAPVLPEPIADPEPSVPKEEAPPQPAVAQDTPPAPATEPPPPSSPEADDGGGLHGWRWAPWGALGTGVVLLAGGGVFAVLSNASREARDDLQGRDVHYREIEAKQQELESRTTIANVLFVAGGLAVLTGGVLFLTTAEPAVSAEAEVSLRIAPSSEGFTAVLEGSL